jgi:5-formyltetrahydrofolate cyclo-ligase
MTLREQKRAVRHDVLARVRALDPARRAAEDARLAEAFPSLPGLDTARRVLLYASALPEEIPTAAFLRRVLDRGQRLVCPRVNRAGRRLDLFRVDDPDRDLVPGALGIPEPSGGCPPVDPSDVDWVLVPGVAFDAECRRLGRGAGYYDRLLATLRPDAPRWALVYDAQWVGEVPVGPFDVPVDGVVSASRTARRDRGTHPPLTSTDGGEA